MAVVTAKPKQMLTTRIDAAGTGDDTTNPISHRPARLFRGIPVSRGPPARRHARPHLPLHGATPSGPGHMRRLARPGDPRDRASESSDVVAWVGLLRAVVQTTPVLDDAVSIDEVEFRRPLRAEVENFLRCIVEVGVAHRGGSILHPLEGNLLDTSPHHWHLILDEPHAEVTCLLRHPFDAFDAPNDIGAMIALEDHHGTSMEAMDVLEGTPALNVVGIGDGEVGGRSAASPGSRSCQERGAPALCRCRSEHLLASRPARRRATAWSGWIANTPRHAASASSCRSDSCRVAARWSLASR